MTSLEINIVLCLFAGVALIAAFKYYKQRALEQEYAKIVAQNNKDNIRQFQEMIGKVKNESLQRTVDFKHSEADFRTLDSQYTASKSPPKPDGDGGPKGA